MPKDPLDRRPLLLGVVHLPPLPGSPAWARRVRARTAADWRARAVRDARTYEAAGFDGVIVENFGDAPFFPGRVPAETAAALGVAARAVREVLPPHLAVGVNVLRNDARTALAVCAAADLDFLRVNVLIGACVTDQGIVEGDAANVLRDRERLAPDVRILADVQVKHAAQLAPRAIEEEAADLVERAGADALVVTGPRTGAPTDPDDLERLRRAQPGTPILVGSGATARTVAALLRVADGVLVGTAVERGGKTGAPVDPQRARAFVSAARGR